MFELLRFDAVQQGTAEQGEAFLAGLKVLRLAGVTREHTNRKYFTWWRGRSVAEVHAVGRAWFRWASVECGGDVYHPPVLTRIKYHKARGDHVALVSGSFLPALAPLADAVSADTILASVPHTENGHYTGAISAPMIGRYKARAVADHARDHGMSLADSHAYGDDFSDAPFMELVGHPTAVINPSSPFAVEVERRGWASLPIDNQT